MNKLTLNRLIIFNVKRPKDRLSVFFGLIGSAFRVLIFGKYSWLSEISCQDPDKIDTRGIFEVYKLTSFNQATRLLSEEEVQEAVS